MVGDGRLPGLRASGEGRVEPPQEIGLAGNQPASTGSVSARFVRQTPILRNAAIRAEAVASVDAAIEVLEGFEGDNTESLIAAYTVVDLQHVRSMLNLEPDAVSEALDAELEDIRDRLEKVRDWFLSLPKDAARSAVINVIIEALKTLAGV